MHVETHTVEALRRVLWWAKHFGAAMPAPLVADLDAMEGLMHELAAEALANAEMDEYWSREQERAMLESCGDPVLAAEEWLGRRP